MLSFVVIDENSTFLQRPFYAVLSFAVHVGHLSRFPVSGAADAHGSCYLPHLIPGRVKLKSSNRKALALMLMTRRIECQMKPLCHRKYK